MDGVQELLGVTVVAATNRPDVIVRVFFHQFPLVSVGFGNEDPALTRPGRLDRIIYVGPPDQNGREEILRIRMRSMRVEPGVDVEEIARLVGGDPPSNRNTEKILDRRILRRRADVSLPGSSLAHHA
jgi:AAA family ATPase